MEILNWLLIAVGVYWVTWHLKHTVKWKILLPKLLDSLQPQSGHQPPAVHTPEVIPTEPWPQAAAYHLPPPVSPQPAKHSPLRKYALVAICALYIIWPIDILPDFIPVLGWGDDAAAFLIAFRAWFSKA
jgi:hypothetical protein